MTPRLHDWGTGAGGGSRVKRGGAGGPDSTVTSYATVPPSATQTKDRHLHPEIGGSTGGFIGLISGLAIFLVVALIAGLFVWNRWYRKRIGPNRHVLPSLTVTGPHDPYTNDAFEPSFAQEAFGGSRGAYTRGQTEEDWEQVQPQPGQPGYQPRRDKGKGKARQVEFDADDYSLRSISPLPRAARSGSQESYAYSDPPSPSPSPTPAGPGRSGQDGLGRPGAGPRLDSDGENPFLGREERAEESSQGATGAPVDADVSMETRHETR